MQLLLLFSVFVIATCGLVYELIAGALASYLLGDSVTQFSTVIGVYLFSMGVGSFLSRFVTRNLIGLFVRIEVLIGLVGGFSAAILFLAFEFVGSFRVLLYGFVAVTGVFVGMEIPLLMRILKSHLPFEELVSRVFTFDYVGALLASLLFPLVLVPHLGLVRSAFLFGILNVGVGMWTTFAFSREIPWLRLTRTFALLALIALGVGFARADQILSLADSNSYADTVVYSKTSRYQRIVLTRAQGDLRLFLNGNLQFSSRDEYRYHEALVHVGLAALERPRDVLVLGGGDGMAVREILKYPSVERVTVVDLDPAMTDLFRDHEMLRALNQDAFHSPRVRVLNEDAFLWLRDATSTFDFIVVDFPDPSNYSVGKLYTDAFYRVLDRALAPGGLLVVQSTSPYVAAQSFWCVDATLRSVGFETSPYHAYVPAFGDWGYILAGHRDFPLPRALPAGLQFLEVEMLPSLRVFPPDMRRVSGDVNKLNNQLLVRHFEEEWSAYAH